jgi:hypothetical protein
MISRASAAVCAAAIAGVLLVPAQSSARGGAGAAGHAGGFPPVMRPMHTRAPLVRPVHRVHAPFVHPHRAPFAHREFRERHEFNAAARRHHRVIFNWSGDYGYGLPVTYGDDGAFYGTYYDPSDLTGSIVLPVYAVPPPPVAPAPAPTTTERPDPPVERAACRSQTVAVSSPGGAERSVTITRC